MPFTFSHPAIVLPLTFLPRKWFSLTGLVIGSLAPDFEYFLRMKVKSDYSHTVIGLFWFDLPLALVLAFLFHNIVRNSLIFNLPYFLKTRFASFKEFNWNSYFKANWFVVAISFLLGSASHLLWDSFTHEHGFFVEAWPALKETVWMMDKHIPVFKLLQHSSTFLGGIIIASAIYNLPVDREVSNNLSIKYWVILATMTITIVGLRLIRGLDFYLYGHLIATAIGATLISLNLTPLIYRQKIKGGNKT